MKRSARVGRVRVTADGEGVVSHAGAELLREMSELTGLAAAWDAALLDTYKALPVHFPGRVLSDMAVAIADGADSISDLQVLRDQPQLFGPVASTPTAWRVLDRVSEGHLALPRRGRATARAEAWAAGAGPDLDEELNLDIDATIVLAHSDKQTAEPTWKKTFGFHPLLCYLDRPEVSSGEALSGIVRAGGAGSNTAKDHMEVLDLALASLPEEARPQEQDPRARVCTCARTPPVPPTTSPPTAGHAASPIPSGSPSPRKSVTFDMIEGFRHTAFIFAPRSEHEKITTGLDVLELHHRRHARVEDRIRQAKAAGLKNLPCKEMAENNVWLELVLAAADLVCWSKLICFFDDEALSRCEIHSFRYRILHVAARRIRSGRVTSLRLDRTWSWAKQLALAFTRLRAAFA